MKLLKYLLPLILFILVVPSIKSQAYAGIQIGGQIYYEPDCPWGYYTVYPYDCAPYGYYGPQWFYRGIFVGVGPWYGRHWDRSRRWIGRERPMHRDEYPNYRREQPRPHRFQFKSDSDGNVRGNYNFGRGRHK